MTAAWFGLGIALLMTVVGTVLATNYRGAATRHVDMASRWAPRWRRGPRDFSGFVALDRLIGALFAIFGAVAVVLSIADLIAGPGRFTHHGR